LHLQKIVCIAAFNKIPLYYYLSNACFSYKETVAAGFSLRCGLQPRAVSHRKQVKEDIVVE